MKLANHLTLRLTLCFILIFSIWAIVYFFLQMREIYDDLDEGLSNLRQEFVLKANNSALFIESMEKYNPLNMSVERIDYNRAINYKDRFSTEKVFFPTEEEEEEVRMLTTAFYCTSNRQYYEIKFFTSNVETDDLVKNMLYLLLTLWLVLTLTIILASMIIIRNSNKPFYKLLNNLKHFQLDRTQTVDFPQTNIKEYNDLNNSIKDLLESNMKTYNDQKNFIENASHEIQTPLAVVISKMEILMNGHNLEEVQMKELNNMLITLNRMKRLNSNLLLLSKIKNKQYIENKDLKLNDIIAEVLENFEGLIQHRDIELQVKETGTFIIDMNADLAHILVNNLIKNAISHNIDKGKLHISITGNTITIMNDGKELPCDADIFRRYYTQGNKLQSSGLGLYIVRSIIDLYHLNITYRFDGMHIISVSKEQ